MKPPTALLDYYRGFGLVTDPGPYLNTLESLPADLPGLVRLVQGCLVHIFWAERYGLSLSEERKSEVGLRKMNTKLTRLFELDPAPLTVPRPLEKRLVGNCRDFSVFLAALVQSQGIPARPRCGFGRYFMPDHFEDHWVCEVWRVDQERWVLVDAQLDAFQQQTLGIDFDPLDVPRDQFVIGGEAWRMCRTGQAKPEHFGIFNMHGWWFIWGDLLRDFYALNKVEILPWDGGWAYLTQPLEAPLLPEAELGFNDCLAAWTANPDEAFLDLRRLYTDDPRLGIPPEILSAP